MEFLTISTCDSLTVYLESDSAKPAHRSAEIFMEPRFQFVGDERITPFRAEDEMIQQVGI